MTDHRLTALERAFELARSGECASVINLRVRLSHEGYSTTQIFGRSLNKQLRGLIREAHVPSTPLPPTSPASEQLLNAP